MYALIIAQEGMEMVEKTAAELAQEAIAAWAKYRKSVDEYQVKLAKIHQEFNDGMDKFKGDMLKLANLDKR